MHTRHSLQTVLFFLATDLLSIFGSDISQDNVPLLREAPEWLNPCRRKSDELDECVRDTFQNMFPFLAKGIPEIGMDAFEPLHIDYVGIKKGSGPVTLNGSFKDLIIHGPSNTTAVYTRFNLKKNKLDIGLFIPTIKVEAQYDLKGKLLLLPLVGVGQAKLHLKNVSTNVNTDIFFPKMSGEEVMVASSMKVDFSLSSMRVHLDNLFNGNKVLGRTVNQFLNQNGLLVVEELKETIGENLAVVFKKVMNDAFSHIPTRLWLMTEDQAGLRNATERIYKKPTEPAKKQDVKSNTEDKKSEVQSTTTSKSSESTSTTSKTETNSEVTEEASTQSTVTEAATSTLKSSEKVTKDSKTTTTPTTSTMTSPTTTTTSTTEGPAESVSQLNENPDDILEELEESRVDREESQNSRSENSNQLDQLQAETSNRLRRIRQLLETMKGH